MNTIQLAEYIKDHPEYTSIVIQDNDEMTPVYAVCFLMKILRDEMTDKTFKDWRTNGTIVKNTLLVYNP
jgi:hypothetical protein